MGTSEDGMGAGHATAIDYRRHGKAEDLFDWTRIIRDFAHDLNSELQPIVSLTALALEDLPRECETWGDLEMVQDAAGRASALVAGMSDYAHNNAPRTGRTAVLAALARAADIAYGSLHLDVADFPADPEKWLRLLGAVFGDIAPFMGPQTRLDIRGEGGAVDVSFDANPACAGRMPDLACSLGIAARLAMTVEACPREGDAILVRLAGKSR